MKVLAGDIGGTKTLLALAEVDGARVTVLREERYDSKAHDDFEDILERFLHAHGGHGLPVGIGVAGPVEGAVCKVTNLPWLVDARSIGRVSGGAARLLNDFEAAAYGVANVASEGTAVLHAGAAVDRAPKAVLGAGTGLGEAIAYWAGTHYEVLATEGGHTDFAARTDDEAALLAWLRRRHEHVSYERVVSGAGLVTVYEHLRERGELAESARVREEMLHGDPAAVIGLHAVSGDDALCDRAFDVFAGVYGAEAGNLALKCLARGGVFLAGGIAAKVLPRLARSPFLEALHAKGRMRALVQSFPVHVVTEARIGLLGAAWAASRA